MGIYNTKAEYDYNTLVKKRNSKNYKTRSASAQYNILNSFRDRNYVDLKSIVYQTLFPKPKRITNNNSPAQHEEVITIREFQNSFTYSASLFEKEYRDLLIPTANLSSMRRNSKHSQRHNESNVSDLEDIAENPLLKKKDNDVINKNKLTADNLRYSYLAKLVLKKIWHPTKKEKVHNTLFFFDWDDTLMCTSFLTPTGVFSDDIKIGEKDKEKIRNLDSIVAEILKRTTERGDVYIVTNAAPGWVEYSAKKFYPTASAHISKVKVISARGMYEKKIPGDTRQWKVMAFLDVLNHLNTKLVTNLICLGDSIIEIEAAHILASKFSQAYIKTIKFKENPLPLELHKQLNLILSQFDKIYSSVKNLAIRVEKKKNEE